MTMLAVQTRPNDQPSLASSSQQTVVQKSTPLHLSKHSNNEKVAPYSPSKSLGCSNRNDVDTCRGPFVPLDEDGEEPRRSNSCGVKRARETDPIHQVIVKQCDTIRGDIDGYGISSVHDPVTKKIACAEGNVEKDGSEPIMKSRKRRGPVRFTDPPVMDTWTRPRTLSEDFPSLFYSTEDEDRFRNEYQKEIDAAAARAKNQTCPPDLALEKGSTVLGDDWDIL
mmetsp:Transcript_16547/g.30104  ORF Transcript_16547/g.30104 Transcript_16547/m.30104 type:complete len:224 (-) Transcript_16547:284-955(-)